MGDQSPSEHGNEVERENVTHRERERDLKHKGAGWDQGRTRGRTTRRPGESGITWGHGKVNKTQVKNLRVRARGGKLPEGGQSAAAPATSQGELSK